MRSQNPRRASLLLALVGLGPAAILARDSASFSVKIPALEVVDASDPIDPSFCGFAFEQASFVRYAQDDNGKPNAFSNNLIRAVTSRTGGAPIIRLGGTSPDYGRYLPGQEEPALPVAEQDNYQNIGFTTIGPSYWALTRNFPGAKYMVQVPLATTNVSETVAWAQSAVEGIGLENIHSIQPGNEADLYADDFYGEGGIELNPPEYQGTLTNETYVGNWTKYVDAILAAVDLPKDRLFSAFDVAAHVGDDAHEDAYVFDVETCFKLCIDARGIIKDVSHHYYQRQAGTAADLASGLMNTTTTHNHLDQFRRHVEWLKENQPGIPFVLNEVGNSLFRTNSYAFQARLGSALWQADFYLYAAAAVGVARVNYQQIMHAGYDLWLPVASAGVAPQVFANFYSQPFVADFLGWPSDTQKTRTGTRAAKLDITGDSSVPPNLAVYAAYEGNEASRIAVTNLDYWNLTSSGWERPSVTLQLQVPRDVQVVTVYHLNSPLGAGAAADSITYGGSQWTYESLGEEVRDVRNDTEQIAVENGVVGVTVQSSEAVLVWL
ncbi:glycoside hydrolase family 79 protein [Daldinia caldariorum]|uniref:glycoside hydrolase family 79 protein n=1 Tax=Daldinia caldariorum TaxID=326644 RepID=UPI0020074EB8|nr:glycoside hydrolase family 79 protein [Daldinia caldariorum]KAI1464137.1 glycoside hydrolase family 79 protein [Daldinia caldariorum]